jgi:AraC-like DNA-binding protein
METEKIFTEPELKLNELADYLKISAHNLSQIINDSFNQSFIDYVNSYRVKEFQNRVQQPDSEKFTMLSLAHEVGFNSKSAFNAAFKKHTGQTPTEFKKLIANSAQS